MHPIIISYFTPGTHYEEQADQLRRSVDRFGLEHRIEPRPAKATWLENCAQKALYIQEKQAEIAAPVLWVDADAALCRRLHELENLDVDIAANRRRGSIVGGHIYFGNTEQAIKLIDRWCYYCITYPWIWDQVTLGYAWWDIALDAPLKAKWLDDDFMLIMKRRAWKRRLQLLFSRPAIIHKQESRRSKLLQETHREGEFKTDQLPDWWLKAAMAEKPFALDAEHRAELSLN